MNTSNGHTHWTYGCSYGGLASNTSSDLRRVDCTLCLKRAQALDESDTALDKELVDLRRWKRTRLVKRTRRQPSFDLARMLRVYAYVAKRLQRACKRETPADAFSRCELRRCRHGVCAMLRVWQRGLFLMEISLMTTREYRRMYVQDEAWAPVGFPLPAQRCRHLDEDLVDQCRRPPKRLSAAF